MTITPRLRVNEEEPSPIVRDFGLYTESLCNNRTPLTPKNQYLAKKHLYQINQLMKTFVTDDNPNLDQPSYPLLNLFYHLALSGQLFRKVQSKGGRFELQPTERYRSYQSLTPAEKYFSLLETLWIDVDWNELNPVRYHDEPEMNIGNVFRFVSQQKLGRVIAVSVKEDRLLKNLMDQLGYYIFCLSFYGFWEATRDEEAIDTLFSKYDFRAATLTPSRFGVTVAGILATTRNLPYWNIPSRRRYGETRVIPGSPLPSQNRYRQFQEMIKEFSRGKRYRIKGKKDRISKEEEPVYKEEPFILPFAVFFAPGELETFLPREQVGVGGNFTFKVSLNKVWRRVKLSAQHTLEDLHLIIQEAFEFNNDHLYCFFMDGKRWSRKAYYSPDGDGGPYANSITLGELDLEPGRQILYLFDYGEEWCFRVILEDIAQGDPGLLEPAITEQRGEAPPQYPLGDDWEDE